MTNAIGAFDPFYYYPLGNLCPVPPSVLGIEKINHGRCGPGVREAACNQCCSKDGYYMSGPNYAGPSLCLSEYGLACDGTRWPPGFNTSLTSRPKLGGVPYGKKIFSCTVENTIALTFDDGPSKWTHGLLDILKANNVKATFFIRAVNLLSDLVYHTSHATPVIIRRIYNDGHQIAGHTWSHRNLDLMPSSERRDEQVKAEIALTDILGFFPTYMRPPFNKCGPQCEADMGNLGYHVASYDINGNDWAGNYTYTEENFLEHIKKKNEQGVKAWVSLAHDTHERTVHGYTQFMIDNAREHGYKFVTLGECMDDPEENWYRDPLTGGRLRNLPVKGSL